MTDSQVQNFRVYEASCNYQINPLCTDQSPVFSWKMRSPVEGDRQKAYRLLISSSKEKLLAGEGDVLDSGRIERSENLSLPYEGPELLPRTLYYWRVEVENREGAHAFGPVSYFRTGKLKEKWQAKWISHPDIKMGRSDKAAPYMRKEFKLRGKVKEASLYLCGLGLYEAYLNGEKISDNLLEPAYTKYDARVLYRYYDLSRQLRESAAENSEETACLGVILGNGWYNNFSADAWNGQQAPWRAIPKMIAELYIEYEDGSKDRILSDESWECLTGPIVFNSVRNGEHYDARLEIPGWSRAGFEHEDLKKAQQQRSPGGLLVASEAPPIRVTKVLKPVEVFDTRDGKRIFDLGQNYAGKARLKACGKRGSHIVLRYAELLTDDKSGVDQTAIKSFLKSEEFQTEHYIKKSDEPEIWSSHFTYHGHRYVEVSCLNGDLGETTLEGLVMHSDLSRRTQFEASDERLKTLLELSHWSTISNMMGLPTSDPHREKNSWTGDTNIAADQTLLNYDSIQIYLKWLDDVCDCQRPDGAIPCFCPSPGWGYNWGNGPDWSMALTAIPWRLYLESGNKKILEKYYPNIAGHFAFMQSMAVDNILDYGIGDWCAPFDGPALAVNMGSFKTPRALTDTSFYYQCACILDKMAEILGKENPYREIKEDIKETLLEQFVDADGKVAGDCQTAYATMLYNQVAGEELEQKMLGHLVRTIEEKNGHLDFGLIGNKFVPESLGRLGRADLYYEMIGKKSYPSYLYWHEHGATTLLECWNMGGSHNHVMFSYVVSAIYYYIAGIRFDRTRAGMKNYVIEPSLLCESLSCRLETPNGLLSLHWEKQADNTFRVEIDLPFGCEAEVRLPGRENQIIKSGRLFTCEVTKA